MSLAQLQGKRILIVGASKGIGKTIAKRLDAEGCRVAIAARSMELLGAVAAQFVGDAAVVQCDVRDPLGCQAAVDQVITQFGGLDALIYCTGIYPFSEIADADASAWAEVLETNVVGAALVTRAALPHLQAARGHAIYLSSNSASYNPPWRGIGLYITSKTALEKLIRCLEVENPDIAFTTHIVGPTAPADVLAEESGQEPVLAEDLGQSAEFVAEWFAKGYLKESMSTPEDHADAVIAVITNRARVPSVMVVPK